MSHYFDAPQDRIQNEFLEPLRENFRPDQLPPKIANVLDLQEKYDRGLKEQTKPENYQVYEQKKQQAEWVNLVRWEAENQLATSGT